MLGLDPHTTDINVVYGAIPRDNKEIALLTRSILEVLVDLSTDIEVPAADVQEKRVVPHVRGNGCRREDPPFGPDSELIGKTRGCLCFDTLQEFLFLDRRQGPDVQKNLLLLDVCLHPGGDRRKRNRSHCDDSYRIAPLSKMPSTTGGVETLFAHCTQIRNGNKVTIPGPYFSKDCLPGALGIQKTFFPMLSP